MSTSVETRVTSLARPFLLALSSTFLALTLFSGVPAHAERGRWTSVADIGGEAIHMALLPGDHAPYHSRVLWWQGETIGGEWGWREELADDGCSQSSLYPLLTLGTGWAPGANIFCSGAAGMGDGSGRLFTAGGTEALNENGLRDARNYAPGAQQNPGTWTPMSLMGSQRWYPTVSTLRDGRMLVASGEDVHPLHSRPDPRHPRPANPARRGDPRVRPEPAFHALAVHG